LITFRQFARQRGAGFRERAQRLLAQLGAKFAQAVAGRVAHVLIAHDGVELAQAVEQALIGFDNEGVDGIGGHVRLLAFE
jgi:hypothetical protein